MVRGLTLIKTTLIINGLLTKQSICFNSEILWFIADEMLGYIMRVTAGHLSGSVDCEAT